MNTQAKVLNFMVREIAFQLQTEMSYNKHLRDEINSYDDFNIALDEANNKTVRH